MPTQIGDRLRTPWGEERVVVKVIGAHEIVSSSLLECAVYERSALTVDPAHDRRKRDAYERRPTPQEGQ